MARQMGKCLTELLVFEQIAVEGRFFLKKGVVMREKMCIFAFRKLH
jgi:hypothetical protein